MATYAPNPKHYTLRYCKSCYNLMTPACTCEEYPGAPHFHLRPKRCSVCQAPLQGEGLPIEWKLQKVRRTIAVRVRQEIEVQLPILPDGTTICFRDGVRLVLANGTRTGSCGQEVWYDAYLLPSWEAYAEADGAVVETPYGWQYYGNFEGNELHCYCSARLAQTVQILGRQPRCQSA